MKKGYITGKIGLGINLKIAREKAELMQKEVSLLIDIDRSSLAFYEISRTLPTVFTLVKLARIYNVNLEKTIAKILNLKTLYTNNH